MMNHVGDGRISSNVDMSSSVVNDFKDHTDGDDHADMSMIADPVGLVVPVDMGEAASVDPLMLEKIANNVPFVLRRKPTKTKRNSRPKKPPDAPKRFKSSFIFFSMEKHKEIKESLAKGLDTKGNVNITNMVAEAWKTLDPLERQKYEEMARQDKTRYDIEKSNYVPPPGVWLETKRKREPGAPKRPMSAYLSFANKIRGKIKKENPDCTNGEISKILSGLWKELPADEHKRYKDTEHSLWETYREKMVEWKKENDGRKKDRKAANLMRQKTQPNRVADSRKRAHTLDFPEDSGVDEQLLGLAGMDANPNTDEMMAASALRGVRGHNNLGMVDQSQNNGYPAFIGVNGMHSMMNGQQQGQQQPSFGQIDMQGYPYNQYNYHMGGNPHAIIMAQLRGGTHAQYPGFMQMDQQANLSQLASLAGVQNDVMQQNEHQQHMQQQTMDQSVSSAVSGINMGMGSGIGGDNIGNGVGNDNSDNSSIPF